MITRAYLSKWLRHKLLFPCLAVVPPSIGYRIANVIGRLDAGRHGTRPAVSRGLCRLFPELSGKPEQLQTLLIRYYQMMARDMLDCFLMPRFTAENTRELIRVYGAEVLHEAQAAGRGVIMIISHFGRFFMLGPGLKFAGLEFGMLTTMADERHPSYDTIDRWYVSTKLYNTQLFSRGTWITTGDDIRRVYRCLQGGEIMLIALDGNETNNPARMEYPFCKGTLSLPGGIVRIAEKTGAKMVYASTIDNGVGVTITLSALPDTPQEAMQAAVALLEQDMCNGPWHWWQLAVSEAFWRQKEDVCTA